MPLPPPLRPRLALVVALPVLAAPALLAPADAGAQLAADAAPGARSAPVRDVRYALAVDAAHVARRTIGVAMTFRVDGAEPVVLALPRWTPGAYELGEFARRVRGFAATQQAVGAAPEDTSGVALAWDKLDPDTWRVRPAGGGQVTVRFAVVADTLDNAMSWTGRDAALVNGTTVFLYPVGQGADWPAAVTVRTEPAWRVATGMADAPRPRRTPAGAAAADAAAGVHRLAAPTYHDLVDMPLLVGRLEVDSAQVEGRWMRLATWPVGSVSGVARAAAWERLRRVVPPMAAVFGGVPWARYTILQLADPSYGGASGLEHQNSHVDVVATSLAASPELTSLYAHEIFHAWNVKRLRPADLFPYRYDRRQPTPWLWVSEGVTDYYADLALVRGGVDDADGFARAVSDKLRQVDAAPATSLEDESLSTWNQPADGTGTLYYAQGALAGLALDAMIREASDGRRSLDDVLRALYGAATRGRDGTPARGFGGDEWWGAVRQAAGRDGAAGLTFADFARRHVDGREPLPLDRLLPLVGLRLAADTLREPRLGMALAPDTAGAVVTEVTSGGAAARAGVRAGDVVLAVADVPLADARAGERLPAALRAAAGSGVVPLRVRRAGGTLTLSARPTMAVRLVRRVELDPAASERARRRRAGLLGAPPAR